VYSPVSHAEQGLGDEPSAGLGQRLLSSFHGSGSYEGCEGEGEGKREEEGPPGPSLFTPARSHAAASPQALATRQQQHQLQQQQLASHAARGTTGVSDRAAGRASDALSHMAAVGSEALRSLAGDAFGSIRFVFDSRELCTSLFLPLHASPYAARVTRSGGGSSSAGWGGGGSSSAGWGGAADDARACLRMTAVSAAAEGAAGASAATPRGSSRGTGAAAPTRTHRISSWVDPQEALGPPASPRRHLAVSGPAAGGKARPRDGAEAAAAAGGCLQQHAVIELRRLHLPGGAMSGDSPCVYLLVAREQMTLLQAYFTAVTWLLCPASGGMCPA
jgi:hypothetical protein